MSPSLVPTCPPDTGAVRACITALRARYRFLESVPIGRSACGREIRALLLGHGSHTVCYTAAIHAQEWITSLLLLHLCEDLCEALRRGGTLCGISVARGLHGRSLVLIPVANPDGVEIALHGSETAGIYASSVCALGGDTPGLWQANARGVDLNHNFDAAWADLHRREQEAGIVSAAPRRYGGPAPHSEPETEALVSLCRRADCSHLLTLHAQGEEIYWRCGEHQPPRAEMMAHILADACGYRLADPEGLAVGGGFKDWFIETFDRPAFTVECGRGRNPLPLSDLGPLYRRLREMLVLTAVM